MSVRIYIDDELGYSDDLKEHHGQNDCVLNAQRNGTPEKLNRAWCKYMKPQKFGQRMTKSYMKVCGTKEECLASSKEKHPQKRVLYCEFCKPYD